MRKSSGARDESWVCSSKCGWHACTPTSARCAHAHASRDMQAQPNLHSRQAFILHWERMQLDLQPFTDKMHSLNYGFFHILFRWAGCARAGFGAAAVLRLRVGGPLRWKPKSEPLKACCARAGFGRFQVVLLLYCGCAWAADAMEMMLLSFLGPAVRCEWGLTPSQEGLITSVVFLARPHPFVFLPAHAPAHAVHLCCCMVCCNGATV